jgi:hypothetical protein
VGFISIVPLYCSFSERFSAIEVRSIDSPLSISFEQVLHFKLELAVSSTFIPGEYAIVRSSSDSAEDDGLSDRKTPAANYYDFGIDIGS